MKESSLESKGLKSYYSKGAIVYKRFHINKSLSLTNMKKRRNLQWFALGCDYGADSYGPIIHTYQVKKAPRLINVGLNSVIKQIRFRAEKGENKDLAQIFHDPWSGGQNNKMFQSLVRKYSRGYDGTIIVTDTPDNKSSEIDEDNEGATEIVLWRGFSDFFAKA